jgi:hypothetical protein
MHGEHHKEHMGIMVITQRTWGKTYGIVGTPYKEHFVKYIIYWTNLREHMGIMWTTQGTCGKTFI